MKIKPSPQRGHVVLDLSGSDVRLLADGTDRILDQDGTELPVVTNDENKSFADIEARANTRTHLMEEILHSRHLRWGLNE